MDLKKSFGHGFSLRLISGIITTLGLIVGLYSGVHSRTVSIGGILTVAIAGAFSDALGVHVAAAFALKNTTREIWEATLSTLVSKFTFAVSFLVPILFLPLTPMGIFNYDMAKA